MELKNELSHVCSIDGMVYDFLSHPKLALLVAQWMDGQVLRHDFLIKLELIKDQILSQHKDPHREISGAV